VRRVLLLLVAVFLVNLPFVHETLTDRELARSGQDVQATVIDTRTVGDRYLVEYRLPESVDAHRVRYSARVDRSTYDVARRTDRILVRLAPGEAATNRPGGAIRSNLFTVVAAIGDTILVVIGLLAYRRWRQRSGHTVVAVDGDDVVLDSGRGELTVVGPPGWAERLHPGQQVTGSLHLASDVDVDPGGFVGGFQHLGGASYVVRGRVLDAHAGRLTLELDDGSRLRVETGGHRVRADIRDPTEVRGTLCFTPTGGRGPALT
jgi:hypothetical protein